MQQSILKLNCIVIAILFISGCSHIEGNVGKMSTYNVPSSEAEWIRNGDPLEFEGETWCPEDSIDILLDSEVNLLGEYQAVQFFIEKADVRPYNQLYTKFGRNKFRIFTKKQCDDQSQ